MLGLAHVRNHEDLARFRCAADLCALFGARIVRCFRALT